MWLMSGGLLQIDRLDYITASSYQRQSTGVYLLSSPQYGQIGPNL